MRRYMAYIAEDRRPDDESKEGKVEVRKQPFHCSKGETVEVTKFNKNRGERNRVVYVGLGSYQFDSPRDKRERVIEVIKKRMDELGLDDATSNGEDAKTTS